MLCQVRLGQIRLGWARICQVRLVYVRLVQGRVRLVFQWSQKLTNRDEERPVYHANSEPLTFLLECLKVCGLRCFCTFLFTLFHYLCSFRLQFTALVCDTITTVALPTACGTRLSVRGFDSLHTHTQHITGSLCRSCVIWTRFLPPRSLCTRLKRFVLLQTNVCT